ncbi:hypothetical protein SDC9_142779 [bioreactor metagenome]|uniref:Uncharacterized protein n=1 Tax=bioreactor metagenome TaxID=1076179 RepID=A0A645E1F9_9ZZZZ
MHDRLIGVDAHQIQGAVLALGVEDVGFLLLIVVEKVPACLVALYHLGEHRMVGDVFQEVGRVGVVHHRPVDIDESDV